MTPTLTAHLAWVIEELSTVYLDLVGRPVTDRVRGGGDEPHGPSQWVSSDYLLG